MRPSWSVLSLAVAVTAAVAAAFAGRQWRNKCKQLEKKLMELESDLEVASQQRSAERTGRIRAQRELRNGLVSKDLNICNASAYPMTPIGHVRSCFSTRNGTPRQPLLVPLARACLTLSPGGVPPPALEGLDQYSHCWLLYVFHENTDLPNLWKPPVHQALKAKVGTGTKA
ncbi:hypothetical protein O6H91_Y224800 [Diphasiastrum complanatum]|nr:hypothetical protein O6H91_Y224800 [Diphasiastrum complanatum]